MHSSSHLIFLFVYAFLAVDSAVATPIPAMMRPSVSARFGGDFHPSHWQLALQEWAFLCIFASGEEASCPFFLSNDPI
jgi:hypothetical protein